MVCQFLAIRNAYLYVFLQAVPKNLVSAREWGTVAQAAQVTSQELAFPQELWTLYFSVATLNYVFFFCYRNKQEACWLYT